MTATVNVTGDELVELDETFTLNLSSAQFNGSAGPVVIGDSQGLGTITNDDSATISIDDVMLNEGNSSTVAFTFTVTLDAEVDTGVSFDFATVDGTANPATTADNDYTVLSATRSFASTLAGSTEQITVQVTGDQKVELDESFFLNLSTIQAGGRDVTFADSQGLGTITNDDSATISINDVSMDEGNAGATQFTFTVTLDAEVDIDVVVGFSTSTVAGEAEDETGPNSGSPGGDDFNSQASDVTFGGNGGVNQTQAIVVEINGDTTPEFDELFNVDLSNIRASGREVASTNSSGITFADMQGQGTITNDDVVTLQINDVVRQEGNLGTSPFVFNITFDNPAIRDFTLDYATEDVTSTAGVDYAMLAGTLMLQAGDTAVTLIVDVTGDGTIEPTESFILRLSNISDAGVVFAGGGTTLGGVGTIINDDFPQELVTTNSSGSNDITITDPETGETTTITPFATDFEGGADVATGDFNFDGQAEVIAAAGPGGGPHVQVFDSSGALFLEFFAYDAAFTGGVHVAAADINRDGVADIITGPGAGGGPHVKVFDGSNPDNLLFNQMVYETSFLGGVEVAAGDVTGDGVPDIIVAPGAGGGPNVKVYDGSNGSVVYDFHAYDPAFAGGVFVSSGDFNGDRFADIVTGAGPGGGPHVKVYSGEDLAELQSVFAYDPAFSGGVDVTAADLNGDGVDDIIVGPSDGSTGVGRQAIDGTTGVVIPDISPTDLGTGPITTSSSATTPNGNVSPYVLNAPVDVALAAGKPLNLAVPDDTFFDENVDDTLTLSAYVDNGDPLPAWLTFDSTTNTFSGTPAAGDVNLSNIRLIADDGRLGTTSTFFGVNVSSPANPSAVVVTEPAADATVANLTPTFRWTDDPNVSLYDLSIVELETEDEIIREKTLTTTSFTPSFNLAEGEYDIRVRGQNVDGVFSGWNSEHHVTVNIDTPALPVPITPTGTINDGTPEFTWTQDINTDHVEISIVDTSTGTEVFRQKDITGVTSFTVPATDVLAADDYHFNMQAWNQLNERSGWTASISFTVNLDVPVSAPEITSPAAGTIEDATPTFAWRSVTNATQYNLLVTDSTTGVEVVNQTGLTTTSFTPSTPIVDGTYDVVVTGTNEAGTAGPSSTVLTITIDVGQPERPVIVAPGTTTPNARPTFAWTPVTDIVEFQLWVSERPTPEIAFIRLTELTTTVAAATKDLPPGDYSVWVKAIDVNGTHNWSLEHQFTVDFDVAALDGESPPVIESESGQELEPAKLLGAGQLLAMNVGMSLESFAVPNAAIDADQDTDLSNADVDQSTNETADTIMASEVQWLDELLGDDVGQTADAFFARDELVTLLLT